MTAWNTVMLTVDGDTLSMDGNGNIESAQTLTGRDAGFVALGVDSGCAEFDNVVVLAP